jgi:hypothetical protein
MMLHGRIGMGPGYTPISAVYMDGGSWMMCLAEEAVVHIGGASNSIDVVNVLYRGTARLRKWDKGGIQVDVIGFTIVMEFACIELFEWYGVLVMSMTGDIIGYKTPPALLTDESTECLVAEESQGVQDG